MQGSDAGSVAARSETLSLLEDARSMKSSSGAGSNLSGGASGAVGYQVSSGGGGSEESEESRPTAGSRHGPSRMATGIRQELEPCREDLDLRRYIDRLTLSSLTLTLIERRYMDKLSSEHVLLPRGSRMEATESFEEPPSSEPRLPPTHICRYAS